MASEIGVRLTGDNSKFKSSLKDAERAADRFGASLGKRLFDVRSIGMTLATALGLNIQNISEQVARLFTGVNKAEEESLKRIADLSTQIADRNIANNRRRLSDEEAYQLMLQDQERLQRRIADNRTSNTQDIARRMEDELKLANSVAETEALALKIEQNRIKAGEERLNQIERVQKMSEAVKKQDAENAKRFARDVNQALETSVDLDEQLNRQRIEALPIEERLVALEKEKRELIEVQKTLVKGSNDFKELQIQINTANADIERTRAEIAEQKLNAEQATTEAMKEQEQVQIRIAGRGNKEISDRELDRKISNLKKAVGAGGGGAGGPLGDYNPLLSMQRFDLQKAIEEQQLRQQVRRSVATLGEDQAFRKSNLSESRFMDILQGATETLKVQREILTVLKGGIHTLPMQTNGGPSNG